MKRYYILLLGLCMMTSAQAQDNDPRKAFDRFAQRSKQKFDDFRSRANEQYAAVSYTHLTLPTNSRV